MNYSPLPLLATESTSKIQNNETHQQLQRSLLWLAFGTDIGKIFGAILLIILSINVITASMNPLLTVKTLYHGDISELSVSPPTQWAKQALVTLLIATVTHREVVVPARGRSSSRGI